MSVADANVRRREEPPDISLTDFVDFVVRQGTARLSKVREIKNRPEYLPRRDFWKPLRDGIKGFHESGGTDRHFLDRSISGAPNGREAHLAAAVAAYKSWLGRKQIEYFAPGVHSWVHRELTVRVNPELGLRIGGEERIVKLYFKKEPVSKPKVQAVLHLMQVSFGSPWVPALLDVGRKKLYESAKPSRDAQLLLESEADAFLRLWRGIRSASSG